MVLQLYQKQPLNDLSQAVIHSYGVIGPSLQPVAKMSKIVCVFFFLLQLSLMPSSPLPLDMDLNVDPETSGRAGNETNITQVISSIEEVSQISKRNPNSAFILPLSSLLSLMEHLRRSTPDISRKAYLPPWTEPYVIGVAGNSGSGKTSVSQKIIQELNQPWTVLLSFDNFYNPLTPQERQLAFNNEFDFDTPESLDLDLLVKCVQLLKMGNKTNIPIYSFTQHNRTDKSISIFGANVIIIEGIYALYDQRLLDLMDLKIFVDTDLDICLARRLSRDIIERGRDLHGAMKQWEKFVKPNAVKYVNHTMQNADLVIPRGVDNQVGINMMIRNIQNKLAAKSATHLKKLLELGKINHSLDFTGMDNIKILPCTNHLKGLHSLIFDLETPRDDFIFYFDLMAIQIVEKALEFPLDYTPIEVKTNGYIYKGLHQINEMMAVNIIRSGDCFMNSVRKTLPEIVIGKLLIQSDIETGEPRLHMEVLLPNITLPNTKVFLFDAQIISGAACIMAIQVLIDYGVTTLNIIVCAYLCTEIGLRRILRAFPEIKIVVGKLSTMYGELKEYNKEGCKDTDWIFSNRFIDSLYFGTN